MVELRGTYQGIKIGSDLHILTSLAIHTSWIFPATYEAIRTGLWRRLTGGNFMDTQTLVVAISTGGTSIAQGFERRRGGRAWTGGRGEQEALMIKTRLLRDEKTTELVAASRASSSTTSDRSNLLGHRSESLEMLPFGDDENHVENTRRILCQLISKLPLIQTKCLNTIIRSYNDPRWRNFFLTV